MYALNFGASKTIWDGNGTVSFNIQDIFNTRAMRSTTNTQNLAEILTCNGNRDSLQFL